MITFPGILFEKWAFCLPVALLMTSGLLLNSGCSSGPESPSVHVLWYDEPAEKWAEALPVGNGRLGAMVFGRTDRERIQFNEESLWAGTKLNNNNPEALTYLPRVRQLIFEGQYGRAYQMASKYLLGTPPRIRSYQTFGDLYLQYHWEGVRGSYRRSLDLHSGIARTRYEVGDAEVVQEVFCTAPGDAIVVRISATKPFDLDVGLLRERDATTSLTSEGRIVMAGQIVDEEDSLRGSGGPHMKFAAMAKIDADGGRVEAMQDHLACREVRAVTITLTAATNYDFERLDLADQVNPTAVCEQVIADLDKIDYDQILAKHIQDHRAFFDRVSLVLGEDTLAHVPTDERLARIQNGEEDAGLIATYFQYGRYLLLGSSRFPGRLPANLQGVWNESFNAPWNSDFHTNINLQMNYWPAEVCNLPETVLPLTAFMEKLSVPGGITARSMYGTDGWTLHHLTDPFGRTGVADGVWGITPLNGPWMTFPLYRHYEYTMDTAYLQRIYPLLVGSAQFALGFLVESPDGYLVSNPSHSPENQFYVPGSDRTRQSLLTYAATTDIQILEALFENVTEAAQTLDRDSQFVGKIRDAAQQLPPVRIGENGTVQEWIHDYEEVEVGHRHMSHLLGLYPLDQITSETPQLFDAARKTIERRLQSGGGHTGWSRAWIVCMYARLHDGEAARDHLHALLAKSTQPNLFDTHPPFQIDGNFGGTAGIAEMLIQSHEGIIRLLPALPSSWPEGSVSGLRTRGGYECDLTWSEGELDMAVIRSQYGGATQLQYGAERITVDIQPGVDFEYRPD